MISGRKLLNTIYEKLNKTERETFKQNEKQWEQIMVEGEAFAELLENEAFKKGLNMAQKRYSELISQLLQDNDREKDISLKAEIKHIINTFNVFYGQKKAKEILEQNLIKKFNLEDK